MRKWITFLMTFLVGSVSYANAFVEDSEVSFEAGYRHDNLGWSAEFPACDPIFKTTSRFKDLDIFQIGVNARANVGCNLYVRASADWGWILDGDTEEKFEVFTSPLVDLTDVSVDAATITTNHDNIVDGRYVFDISGAIGYPFYFCDCTMQISPLVGYSFSEQNICVESSENFSLDIIDGVVFPTLTSECCCDKFISRWYGPFIGFDWSYAPCNDCWGLYAQLEYHWAHYKAKRHDRTGFSDFDHFDSTSHNAHGWVFKAGIDYEINNCWAVGLNAKFQDWSASRVHRNCESSSEFDGIFTDSDVSSRLRSEAHWHSYSVNLEFIRKF